MSAKAESIVPIPSDSGKGTPIPNKWVFWYLIPCKGGQNVHWSEYLHPLHSFDTIEGFCKLLSSIEHLHSLLKGCRYYVFREGVKPLWEDPSVKDGNVVSIEMDKTPENTENIEQKWQDIIIPTLNEELGPDVVGVEFASRETSWRMASWIKKDSKNIDKIFEFYQNALPNLSNLVTVSKVGN
ncbi:translation initiation factor 4E-related protein [Trichomonas vaginalis G3]|uniref:Translation initiation factor 4E-related protein n=1 Tax=Trichomonas vaginalis (strain ATCC PRA-98 / G3) TaxID=412133 RepID=A2E7K0_TRIV3|nr:translation initiation factor protein [Trichomonas vaginalis G3]EAY11393.1 translation initiation factor 4E-related protein [Trichomonas vaginalis G3]KAI5530558.1 translation initiation factor protein [Trichomonas vaginalis G3]|eukprot:XP_001323616.1 translation initiation factor 4E-related protein [Trichomonas vaginalis G3]